MSAAAAPAPLDRARVRAITRELQRSLDRAVALAVELYEGRAWLTAGFDSWQDFVAAELPQLRELNELDRRAVVVELRGRGASLRAAGAAVGLSAATVKTYSDDAGVQLATVTGIDGVTRPATSSTTPRPRPRTRRTDRAVELIRAAGPDGLTVRQLCAATRWQQHVASATLTRLQQSGRIAYRRPARRGLFGAYVVAGD